MLERALLAACIAIILALAASSVGGALSSTFTKINLAGAHGCEAHAKDTCK